MDKVRVAQWTTGNVGKFTLRAIIDNPTLELAGVFAYSADKAGLDAGDLCDRPHVGIRATDQIDAIIAARPDVVVYTPFTGDVDEVVRLLENGINVLSTNLFFHVGGVRGNVKARMQAAGDRGGASIYITGVNPGWINAIATAVTAICNRVDRISIIESADCSTYESPETWNFFRMGQRGTTPEVIEAAKAWLVMFRDAAERVAEGLGIEIDDFEFYCDYATAADRVDLGWFLIEQGTNAAVRAGWRGRAHGEIRVCTQVTWYLTRNVAEDWDIDTREYHLEVQGEPTIDLHMHFGMPNRPAGPDSWDQNSITAFAAVNAVRQIIAARPGVVTLHDMGLPHAPLGEWERGQRLA